MSINSRRTLALMATGLLLGATVMGGTVSTNISGFISIAFNIQVGAPMPESLTVVGATNPPVMTAGSCPTVSYVTFSFLASDCAPSELRLCLTCRNGRQWFRTLTVPTVGEWKQYIVAVDYSQGWTIGPWKTEALFQSDSTNIVSGELTVSRGGNALAQSYALVDFSLEGIDWGTGDADGDGSCNAAEIVAGTDPFNHSSVLSLSRWAATGARQGFGVEWDSVTDRFYTLWRGTNLMEPWASCEMRIPANTPRNFYWDDGATGPGPYFYKITVGDPVQ